MTLKAHTNQQSTIIFFRGDRHVGGRAAIAVPALRRGSRHSGHFLADAILFPGSGDVNLNMGTAAHDPSGATSEDHPTAVPFVTGVGARLMRRDDSEVRIAAGLDDDEDKDDDDEFDDDELDEDDDEDLEGEDDEDFDDEDDLDDEDDELDDDDLDKEDDDEDDE